MTTPTQEVKNNVPKPAGTHCFSGRVSVVKKAKPPPQAAVNTMLAIKVMTFPFRRSERILGDDSERNFPHKTDEKELDRGIVGKQAFRENPPNPSSQVAVE